MKFFLRFSTIKETEIRSRIEVGISKWNRNISVNYIERKASYETLVYSYCEWKT